MGSLEDCDIETEYCSSNKTCLPLMACNMVEDCTDPNNYLATVGCVGTSICDDGMCSKTCDEVPAEENGSDADGEEPSQPENEESGSSSGGSSDDGTVVEDASASSLSYGIAVAIVATATAIAAI